MELWIRSQDKEMLSLVKTLVIEDINDDNKLFGITDGYVYHGEYNSKERALEVLDEIQEAMMLNEDYDYSGRVEVNTIRKCLIYEMPKD